VNALIVDDRAIMPKDDEQLVLQAQDLTSAGGLSPIESLGGTENWAALKSICELAARDLELIVLAGPSARLAGAAILGAREARRPDPCQIYAIHEDSDQLHQLWCGLVSTDLDENCLLYRGNLVDFFRDIPVAPTLLFSADSWISPELIQANLPPRAFVLVAVSPSQRQSTNIEACLAYGLVTQCESKEPSLLFKTTDRCAGRSVPITPEVFRHTRSALHRRYFDTKEQNVVTASVATRNVRRTWINNARAGVSGYGRWPWPCSNQTTGSLPKTLPNGAPWPRISIVTPSFNQGRYLEETILSVLNQKYPNLEHIVIDGGSTDETSVILDRYRERLTYVISEPDRGQSHAINKGMKKATGEILTWLNSDDMLAPGSLTAVAMGFDTSGADLVAGICQLYSDRRLVEQHLTACADGPLPLDEILDLDGGWNAGEFFYQPEVMFTRSIWEAAGGQVDENCSFSMDYELWLRFAELGARLHVIGRPVAWFRLHEDQKTAAVESFKAELLRVRDAYVERTGRRWTSRIIPPNSRRQLRFVLLNDHGFQYGAGAAHQRIAESITWAGHAVIPMSLAKEPNDKEAQQTPTNQRLFEDIASHRPDIIIVGNLHSVSPDPGFLLLLAERFPTLCFLHDFWLLTGRCAYPGECTKYLSGCDETCPTPHEYPQLEPQAIASAWEAKRTILTSRLPILLANSAWTGEFARKALSGLGPARAPRIEEVQLSFPLQETFRRLDKRTCRHLLGLPENRFIVLLTCEFADRRKGSTKLLEALHELQLADTLLVSTSWSDPDQNLLHGLDVRRFGYVTDPQRLATIYCAADLLVGPSSEETFGQVFIEAAACGTPAVGFPTSGVQAAIRDGVTGRLAAGTEVSDLAAAILELYRNPTLRENLSRWGRLYVENEWSPFSAYHKFFLTLDRLGLREQLKMLNKISFIPGPALVPECRPLTRTPAVYGQGLCDAEGPIAEFDLPKFRWALGPQASFEFDAQESGRHLIAIYYRNVHPGQTITVEVNNLQVGSFRLVHTGIQEGRMLWFNAALHPGRNIMKFRFSIWHQSQEDHRPLALLITKILWFPQ
jgi:glycosyltransferase involved in cell wall biosynthesis